MLAHRLGKRAEDDPHLVQLGLEGRRDRNRVEDRVHRDAGERRPLVQRDAQLLVGLEELRIDVGEGLRPVLLRLRRRVVDDRLIVDRRIVDVLPGRLGHGEPVAIGLEAPLEEPLGLPLESGDLPHRLFRKAGRQGLLLDVGDETELVLLGRQLLDGLGIGRGHLFSNFNAIRFGCPGCRHPRSRPARGRGGRARHPAARAGEPSRRRARRASRRPAPRRPPC